MSTKYPNALPQASSKSSVLQQVFGSDLIAKDSYEASEIKIFRDNPFADKIVDILDHEEYTWFAVKNIDDDYPLADCDVVSAAIMICSVSLHESLFAFPPNLIVINDDDYDMDNKVDSEECKALKNNCYFEISKVGKVTGELCMTITGEYLNVVQKFLQYNQRIKKYEQIIVVSRDQLLNDMCTKEDFWDIQISRSESPSYIVPGYFIKVEGCDPEYMSTIIASRYTCDVNDKLAIRRPFNHPPKSQTGALDEFPVAKVLDSQDYQDSETKKPALEDITNSADKIKYVHLKLTRKEVTYIIGKGGSKVEQLRRASAATIKIIPLNSHMNDDTLHNKTVLQFIRISGTSMQIKTARIMIEDELYQFRLGGITSY